MFQIVRVKSKLTMLIVMIELTVDACDRQSEFLLMTDACDRLQSCECIALPVDACDRQSEFLLMTDACDRLRSCRPSRSH